MVDNSEIEYSTGTEGLSPEKFVGFFENWPNPPSPETLHRILRDSEYVVIARERALGTVVGFINAISDHTLSAYIPLLEVLPDYRHRGIATELVNRMLELLKGYYMVDLVCDVNLEPFYRQFGFQSHNAMTIRNYQYQAGRPVQL